MPIACTYSRTRTLRKLQQCHPYPPALPPSLLPPYRFHHRSRAQAPTRTALAAGIGTRKSTRCVTPAPTGSKWRRMTRKCSTRTATRPRIPPRTSTLLYCTRIDHNDSSSTPPCAQHRPSRRGGGGGGGTDDNSQLLRRREGCLFLFLTRPIVLTPRQRVGRSPFRARRGQDRVQSTRQL